ncbi:Ni/Fe hydrogenase subunit alpha [Actinoallomurus soli]|uniref:Ni/Fe hydrogenase subunit alpha n=1 Tax=Actinoallomurus soli TaxID=2952535 RepID=UPI0020928DF0|nr:Ni/Fe hydrogenase subunit alpha [Actinoallomurus soli]MCO5967783.1 Ni/Fe hydrogenase subunit alpha [Actinoallomurus soli]
MTHRHERILNIGALARVEGEGAMRVRVTGDRVEQIGLNIYEPPRFFEAFLRGRAYTEPPDITSRICGICPVAYQMSACRAVESACGVAVDGPLGDLRRLLYCGEWIQSHALHIYLLHAPDFLGYPSAVEMARAYRPLIERGLELKKTGNMIIDRLGGRPIHPVNVRIGGFHRVPTPRELRGLVPGLRRALEDALATVRWVAGFDFPDLTFDHEFLALTGEEYPLERGTPRTTTGASFEVADFEDEVVEYQVPHSTALHSRLVHGGRYLTGPLARFALNRDRLSPLAHEAAADAGLGRECRNPFQSIVVRAVEIVHAIEEALRIIASYEPPPPSVPVPPRAGRGHGATEAPRGLLFHRYDIGADGLLTSARIVPPTSQNQAAIEEDLRHLVQERLDLDDEALTSACERTIRSYDPCISCAAHFLDLKVVRS